MVQKQILYDFAARLTVSTIVTWLSNIQCRHIPASVTVRLHQSRPWVELTYRSPILVHVNRSCDLWQQYSKACCPLCYYNECYVYRVAAPSEGRREWEIDRQIVAVAAGMLMLR